MIIIKTIRQFNLLLLLTIAMVAMIAANPVHATGVGNVYVMNNDPDENRVIAYKRFHNGKLKKSWSVRTAGFGAGDNASVDPLGGAQGSVLLSQNKRTLYVVNAGSNNISVFYLRRNGRPILIQVIDSEGEFPVSLTSDGEILYVLNAGGDGAIAGYYHDDLGRLTLIPNSVRALGLGEVGTPVGDDRNLAPGGIVIDSLSRRLMITHAGANQGQGQLLTFSLNDDASPSATATETNSPGAFPFSIGFTKHGSALVAEASGSVSSFNFGAGADLVHVSSVQSGQAETCWIQTTSFGIVYTTNTGAGTISSYEVSRNGNITLLESAAADDIGGPINFQLTPDERYMYVLAGITGGVEGYRIDHDTGALRSIGFFPGLNSFDSDGFAPQGIAVR